MANGRMAEWRMANGRVANGEWRMANGRKSAFCLLPSAFCHPLSVPTPSDEFMAEMRALEPAYLEHSTPEGRSGFSGGRERWVQERSPLVEAIDRSGDFLDVGCANGLLAADVVDWAAVRGHTVVPFGIDLGPALIEEARARHPDHPDDFVAADVWLWEPDRTWDFVYSLTHLAAPGMSCTLFERLLSWVAPGGRLIVGAYGSRSRGVEPEAVDEMLASCGHTVAGAAVDDPAAPLTRFGWVDGVG